MYKYTASYCYTMTYCIGYMCRSQLPRGLKRESATACLLGLRVRIPPGAWMLSLVNVVCCQVEVSAKSRSLAKGVLPSLVCLSTIVKPRKRVGPGPLAMFLE